MHTNARRELDVEMARNKITSLEARLRFTRTEIKKFQDQIEKQGRDVESSGEPAEIEARIEGRKVIIEDLQKEIKQLEKNKSQIQDEVFSDFCKKVGIKNIR